MCFDDVAEVVPKYQGVSVSSQSVQPGTGGHVSQTTESRRTPCGPGCCWHLVYFGWKNGENMSWSFLEELASWSRVCLQVETSLRFPAVSEFPGELTTSQGGVAMSPAARQVRRGFQNGRGQDGPLEAHRVCGGGWGDTGLNT